MNYLGYFSEQNFPNIGKSRLITHVDGAEVIIHYNTECPFYIEHIAVFLDRKENVEIYDVFECGMAASTDEEAKVIAKSFAENLIKYRRTFTKYHNNLVSNS